MREPERITAVLSKIQAIWEKHPDMRLMQLLLTVLEADEVKALVAPVATRVPTDPFFVEDYRLVELLDKLALGKKDWQKQDENTAATDQIAGNQTYTFDLGTGDEFRKQRAILDKIIDVVGYLPAVDDLEQLEGLRNLTDEIADQAGDNYDIDCRPRYINDDITGDGLESKDNDDIEDDILSLNKIASALEGKRYQLITELHDLGGSDTITLAKHLHRSPSDVEADLRILVAAKMVVKKDDGKYLVLWKKIQRSVGVKVKDKSI